MEKGASVFFFDMDHTLINADCDVTWKYFVVRHGLAPESALQEAERFFEDYNAGCLDEEKFHEFQFREFRGRTVEEMAILAEQHFEEFIRPKVYADAVACIRSAQNWGCPTAILTSTNSTIAGPVAAFLGIPVVLGTRLETTGGRYTGRISGTYGVGQGKVVIASEYAREHGISLADFAYYGDSINDRNILEAVGFPCAVNPSAALRELAGAKGWRILNWK